jgi:hypothetical protein
MPIAVVNKTRVSGEEVEAKGIVSWPADSHRRRYDPL